MVLMVIEGKFLRYGGGVGEFVIFGGKIFGGRVKENKDV